jgi:tetratricopeptide (TPR) repeat protein
MSFAGDLQTFDVFDMLSWLAGRRKGGLLTVSRRSTRKTLAFREGELQWSGSNDPRETLGQALVRDALITEEALFRALLKQETEKRRLGELLVADGLLTEQQLLHSLRANAEAQVHELFLWPAGRFEFDDSDVPPQRSSDLGITIPPLLEEGRHRREMWRRLRERFPSGDVTFRVKTDPSSVADPLLRDMVDLAVGGRSLAAISLETRRSEYETALLLSGLCDQEALAVAEIPAGPPAVPSPESDPVGTIKALRAFAEMCLDQGRFDEALESYEKVLTIDRVNQDAKKGLLAVAEARRQAKLASKVPLDRVPALRMTAMALAQQQFTPQEGFLLSRINGQWDIRSLLKVCPMPEESALVLFARLLERNVIELR